MDLDWDAIARQFAVDDDDVSDRLPPASYAVAPTQTIGIVAQGRDGRRHLNGAHWSLIPRWSASKTLSYPTYNARMESAQHKPTFAESVQSMRAVIPASGYYEWKGRRPFYFHAEHDAPLLMAGLYSWWRPNASAPWLLTATILTCPAAEEFARIHDRMPMLVPADMTGEWLDRSIDGARLLRPVCEAGAELSRALRFHEVAPLSGDGRRLVAPLEHSEPMSLF